MKALLWRPVHSHTRGNKALELDPTIPNPEVIEQQRRRARRGEEQRRPRLEIPLYDPLMEEQPRQKKPAREEGPGYVILELK